VAVCPGGGTGRADNVVLPDQGVVDIRVVVGPGSELVPASASFKWARPTVKGKVKVGGQVKASTKGWTKGTAFAFAWKVAGKTKSHAAAFKIKKAYKGKQITVKVTGALAGKTKSLTSKPKRIR